MLINKYFTSLYKWYIRQSGTFPFRFEEECLQFHHYLTDQIISVSLLRTVTTNTVQAGPEL